MPRPKANRTNFATAMEAKMAEKAQLEQNINETLAEIDGSLPNFV